MISRRAEKRAARETKQARAALRDASVLEVVALRTEVESLQAENARLRELVDAVTEFQFWGGTVLCPRRAKVSLFESPSGARWWAVDLLLGVDGSRMGGAVVPRRGNRVCQGARRGRAGMTATH
jgi:hypothetical protein